MTIYSLLTAIMVCLLLYLIVRSFNERFAVFVTIGGTLMVLFFVCSKLSSVFTFANELSERIGVESKYFKYRSSQLDFARIAGKADGRISLKSHAAVHCWCWQFRCLRIF